MIQEFFSKDSMKVEHIRLLIDDKLAALGYEQFSFSITLSPNGASIISTSTNNIIVAVELKDCDDWMIWGLYNLYEALYDKYSQVVVEDIMSDCANDLANEALQLTRGENSAEFVKKQIYQLLSRINTMKAIYEEHVAK